MQNRYDELRHEKRVVMRHSIALNIDNFRASSDDFDLKPEDSFPALQPTDSPLVSVIIPHYNGLPFLETVFSALERQTFQDFEVILVDDASTDGSVEFLEEKFSHRLQPPGPDSGSGYSLRIIANRSNHGFVSACNQGGDVARGRLLALLNNDTEPEPDWLAELVKAICANPDAAIVASKMLLFDKRDHIHSTGDMLLHSGIPVNRGVWETDKGQYDHNTAIFSACGGGSLYRKDVWQQLGGFDEDFWMYIEDVDYAFRCHLAGWRVVFAPAARLYHHLSATGGGKLASYYVGRNTIWMVAKNMPRKLLLQNLSAILHDQIVIMLDALRHVRGEAARARLRGQWAGLLGLHRQLQKRRIIQQRRILSDDELQCRLN